MAEEKEREVPPEVTKVLEAIEALSEMEDDAACTSAVSEILRRWPDLGSQLRRLRETRVNALRANRRTWPEIAKIIGDVTPERAQQISKGLSGASRKKAARKIAEEQADT
ncbi:hypothetical protein ABZX75_17355 [Streptomyces sp. NPDC003038]|uniref:hypothetical protein n=1 Tax=unclassified Streptomyces TaxID=2593676 RepID=UPI0033A7E71B